MAQAGWVPQQRPSSLAQDPQGTDPASYDWTGLTGTLNQTDGSNQYYTSYFGDGNYDAVELDLGGSVTGTSGSWSLSGTSTYKWLWTPPANPQGVHNDPAKAANDPTQPFPTPPLFALGITVPYVEGAYDESGAPLAGAGNVADGFDPKWTPKFDLLSSSYAAAPADSLDSNGNFINQLPRRSILAGALEGDQATAHVTLSPGLEVHVSNQDGGGSGYGYGYMEEGNCLISLYSPNPYLRPDLGDFSNGAGESGNQFLYDAQLPGHLSIPAQIGVPGALYLDDFDWLIKPPTGGGALVDWRFGVQGDTLPSAAFNLSRQVNSDRNEYVLAPDTMITTAAGKSVPGITSTGLPVSNTGFGTYPVTMTVKTYDPASKTTTVHDSQTAYIQTFFQGAASNFPDSVGPYTGDTTVQTAQGPYSPPNWYNYYTQVYNIANEYGASVHYEAGTGPYNSRSFALDDPNNGYPVEIHDDAGKPRSNLYVFDINPTPDPKTGTHLARYIGVLSVKGLFSFICACGHEAGHVVTYTTPDDTPPGGYVFRADIANLSPSWKLHHHLDPGASDTTGAYSGFQGDVTSGDAQLTADVNAVKDVLAYADSLQGNLPQDWSDGGVNYSGTTLPYFAQERYNNDAASLISGKPPVFYLKFTPMNQPNGSPVVQPAVTPVVSADGRYEIRGLADLRALYPNVVIGLGGLTYEDPSSGP